MLLERVPADIARGECGELLRSRDLARLAAMDPERGRERLAWLGRLEDDAITHFADGMLSEADLAAFAASGVSVRLFSGTDKIVVDGDELRDIQAGAKPYLEKEWEQRYGYLGGSNYCGGPLLLQEHEQLQATVATCRVERNELDGTSEPARTMILGTSNKNKCNIVLRYNEFWYDGDLLRVTYYHECVAPSCTRCPRD